MNWLGLVLAVVVAAGIVFVPGLALGVALGLRRLPLASLAPALSTSLIAVASLVAPAVGLRWTVIPLLLLTVLAVIAAIVVRRFVLGGTLWDAPRDPALRRAGTISLVVAAALLSFRFLVALPAPDAFAATFDNVFHLNAVQYALDTGSASSLTIGRMNSPGGGLGFYPAAWHALAALVVQLAGVSVPVGVNALTLVVAAMVWPLGVVALLVQLLPPRPALIVATGLTAAALPTFPYLLVIWGSLYPLLLAIALVPAAAAATWSMIRAAEQRDMRRFWTMIVLQVLVSPGIAIAHPGAALIWLTIAAIMVGSEMLRASVRRRGIRRAALVLGAAAIAVAWLAVLQIVRPPASQLHWQPTQSVSQAVGELATYAMNEWAMALPLALLTLGGIVTALRRRSPGDLVLLWSHATLGALFVTAAGGSQAVRILLTGPWYTDIARISSFIGLSAAPLAAVGAASAWAVAIAWIGRIRARPLTARGITRAAIGAGIIAVLATQATVVRPTTSKLASVLTPSAASDAVSPDELTLMRRLDRFVPAGATIVADPWSGAAFAYAVADRRVFPSHLLYDPTPDQTQILQHLSGSTPGGPVCTAVKRTNTRFVLSFGGPQIGGVDRSSELPGLLRLDDSRMVALMFRVGAARLYRITGC